MKDYKSGASKVAESLAPIATPASHWRAISAVVALLILAALYWSL